MALILSVDPGSAPGSERHHKLTANDITPRGRDQRDRLRTDHARRALGGGRRVYPVLDHDRLEFLGAGKDCFMRANVRMFNPRINTVRLTH